MFAFSTACATQNGDISTERMTLRYARWRREFTDAFENGHSLPQPTHQMRVSTPPHGPLGSGSVENRAFMTLTGL
jgi:hypothetical protein